ncbi:GTPase [Streptococcus infantarius]|nr:GTPase [Streptococcus infantarius]
MKLTSTEHTIIHTAAAAAATTAASPIPFSDAALLIPIQATMITSLYKANGANISQGFVKGVLKATVISNFGKSLAGNLLKFIPGVGTLAGGTINAGVAVGFTEALGFAIVGELRGTDNADLIDLANVIKDVLEGFTKK